MGLEHVLDTMKAEPDWSGTPGLTTVYRWMEANEAFAESSARARVLSADTYADAAVNEAHTGRIGLVTTTQEWGTQQKTGDNVERSKLIVQTLMKRAGQLNPKKYGDRLDLNHAGKDGGPLVFEVKRVDKE